jgi:hypothetical protein
MREQFPQLFMFFTVTGVLWWGWLIMKLIDLWGMHWARKNNKLYYSTLENKNYDFRIFEKSINDIDAKPTVINLQDNAEEIVCCSKCEPKPKWERLNVEEKETDDSGRI